VFFEQPADVEGSTRSPSGQDYYRHGEHFRYPILKSLLSSAQEDPVKMQMCSYITPK